MLPLGIAAAAFVAVWAMSSKLFEPTSLLEDGTVSADGSTPAPPLALAAGAGLSKDAYALSRMIVSEAGNQPAAVQTGVAFATITRARARKTSVGRLLTTAKFAGDGYFGKQNEGRYAATSHDSTPASRTLAMQALRRTVADPTGGAEQWDSPRAYGDWTGSSSAKADAVEAARTADGMERVVLAGVDPTVIRFWRRANAAA